LVYATPEAQLETLAAKAKKGKGPLPGKLSSNSAANRILARKDAEAASYLLFARRCEPHATAGSQSYYYWEPPVRDTAAIKVLIMQGKKAQDKAKTAFLKERYAFQVIRLSRYIGKAQDAVDHYDAYFGKNFGGSYIARRSLSMKAGALKDLRRYGEARYIFAMLFDKHHDEADWSVYSRSFRFSETPEDAISPDAYSFCRSNHERAAVLALEHMMEGAVPDAKVLETMYAYEPSSPYLNVLLVRHMRQAHSSSSRSDSRRVLRELIGKGGLSCPQLWKFSAGYLAYLDGDYGDAEEWYAAAERSAQKDQNMLDHIKVMRIVQRGLSFGKADKVAETALFADMQALAGVNPGAVRTAAAGRRHIMAHLSTLYDAQGDTIKRLIAQSLALDNNDKQESLPDELPLDRMIAFMEGPKSPFEEFLFGEYWLRLEQCYEWKGVAALRAHRYKEAMAWFKKGLNEELWTDPFLVNIQDCHDCDYHRSKNMPKLTRLEFTQKLAELEKLAAQPGPKQAEYCLQYGMGLYNMTYYGNSWHATQDERPHGDDINDVPLDIEKYHRDCSKAMGYFDKAMKLTKDKELAAKCCFLAAKCEQKLYFISGEVSAGDIQPEKFRTYFQRLKDSYQGTRFYKEALRECSYFSRFAVR